MSLPLLACPCGKVPASLHIIPQFSDCKWAYATGTCCGEWHVEFRTNYYEANSPELMARAIAEWNKAPRGIFR